MVPKNQFKIYGNLPKAERTPNEHHKFVERWLVFSGCWMALREKWSSILSIWDKSIEKVLVSGADVCNSNFCDSDVTYSVQFQVMDGTGKIGWLQNTNSRHSEPLQFFLGGGFLGTTYPQLSSICDSPGVTTGRGPHGLLLCQTITLSTLHSSSLLTACFPDRSLAWRVHSFTHSLIHPQCSNWTVPYCQGPRPLPPETLLYVSSSLRTKLRISFFSRPFLLRMRFRSREGGYRYNNGFFC
jgi:hypothetical protein